MQFKEYRISNSSKMFLIKIILLGILISTGVVNAQSDFRPGYIIKNNGDTLFGDIDYRGDLFMSIICRFKNTEAAITEYSPNEIIAYRFIDSKYFITRKYKNKNVFLEYLIKGKVNIYYLHDNIGHHYFIDKENEILSEMPYEEGIKYINDTKIKYVSKRHIGFLNYYMQDAPELKKRINSFKKPGHKSLIKLAEDYHNAVCEGDECIIYEKTLPFLKVNLELVSGVVNYENVDNLNDKFFPQNGFLINFWLPRTNEKIYIKTGYLFSEVENLNGDFFDHSIIPVHIGYFAPNTYRIRPSISIGLISPSYSGGLAVKINKTLNIGIQGWVNFYAKEYIPIVPDELFNYSILGNIYIEF